MLRVLFSLGFLFFVWGDEYYSVVPDNHFISSNSIRRSSSNHYYSQNNKSVNKPSVSYQRRTDNYLPKSNKKNIDQKIVGGEETTIEELPYQTSLRYITSHICGASIIDEKTAITAAHCVYGQRSSSYTLWSGTTYINDVTHPGKLSFVDRVIIHEGYNTTSQDNDIAILKLFQPLQFGGKIKPIALQDSGQFPSKIEAIVSGWGRTQEGKPTPSGPRALRKTTVTVLSRSECEAFYPGKLTTSMICAYTPGKDSCQGDSGGPLAADKKLIGVVSWGFGCARPGYPGVYTSIASLRHWIDKHRED